MVSSRLRDARADSASPTPPSPDRVPQPTSPGRIFTLEGLLCAKQSEEITMLAKSWKAVGWIGAAGVCASVFCTQAMGARYADVLGYYEPGQNVDAVFGSDPVELFDNAQAALSGPGEEVALSQGTLTQVVSLGGWTDDPATGTNSLTPGLVVGFSVEVLNAPGDDLLIVGNAPAGFTFYEPGFVEVAVESDGGGATPGAGRTRRSISSSPATSHRSPTRARVTTRSPSPTTRTSA